MEICRNAEQKRKVAVTLFQYVMEKYHEKLIEKLEPNAQTVSYLRK